MNKAKQLDKTIKQYLLDAIAYALDSVRDYSMLSALRHIYGLQVHVNKIEEFGWWFSGNGDPAGYPNLKFFGRALISYEQDRVEWRHNMFVIAKKLNELDL